jgi:hypothetical protein
LFHSLCQGLIKDWRDALNAFVRDYIRSSVLTNKFFATLALKAVSLVLKRNVTEGVVLLCAVHCPEFGGEIQVQFVATHVVMQGAVIERSVDFHDEFM